MNKKKQDIYDFDYPELDLSGDEKQPLKAQKQVEGQPYKKIKTDPLDNDYKNKGNAYKQIKSIPPPHSNLPFFPLPLSSNSRNQAWIPPPPIHHKFQSNHSNISQQRLQFNKGSYDQSVRDNRQKNNLVYVKNIPRNFNTQQKLMTFFKNQGIIKQIKTKQADQSAVIRFLKDDHAVKFLKSNKLIFNRSFIVYGNKDNLTVSQQQIQDRVNDEQGIIKKAEQTNMKVLKQKAVQQIADQIRALYFFQKQIIEDNQQSTQQFKMNVMDDLTIRMKLKTALQNQQEDRKIPQDCFFTQYNWNLKIKRQNVQNVDKKTLFAQFLKFGPIINLDSQYQIIKKTQKISQNIQQNAQLQIYDYEINILFMSLRNLWCYYNFKKEEQSMEIEGRKVQRLFDSGKLKTIEFSQPVETIDTKKTVESKDEQKVSGKDDKVPVPINFGGQTVSYANYQVGDVAE